MFYSNFEDLRGAYGLGSSAITPFGPISVYFAVPFNNDQLDRTKRFEFSMVISSKKCRFFAKVI